LKDQILVPIGLDIENKVVGCKQKTYNLIYIIKCQCSDRRALLSLIKER